MTREESMSLEIRTRDVHSADDTRRHSDRRQPRVESTSRHLPEQVDADISRRFNGVIGRSGRDEVITRSGAIEEPARQRHPSDFATSDHEPPVAVDARPHPSIASLERRLSSHYDPKYADQQFGGDALSASLPPRPLDARPASPRVDVRDAHDRSLHRDMAPASWDRPERAIFREESPPAATKVHPDRARLLHHPPAPPSEQEMMRTSKPVRIRRPPPMATKLPGDSGDMSITGPESSGSREHPPPRLSEPEPQLNARPGLPSRASLLDRISVNHTQHVSGDGLSPSLWDRVDSLPKRPGENLDAMRLDDPMDDYDGRGEQASRGFRGGKRRNSKRGRR